MQRIHNDKIVARSWRLDIVLRSSHVIFSGDAFPRGHVKNSTRRSTLRNNLQLTVIPCKPARQRNGGCLEECAKNTRDQYCTELHLQYDFFLLSIFPIKA